ncbi:hypothetical protein KIW84_020354 [Lathyrus oleraceus]|uniref:Uncharacterized protein n=1 Tax=Pisum sativum TaxID=3888 RepID=A0A9D4Y543_PEA|nr:hypothetical protein KIW84_020354 [Pisum sativum]
MNCSLKFSARGAAPTTPQGELPLDPRPLNGQRNHRSLTGQRNSQEPPSSAPKAKRDAYKKHVDDVNETACLMLATMNSELQKQHDNMAAFDMIEHLKMLYQEQARHKRFEVSKALFKAS